MLSSYVITLISAKFDFYCTLSLQFDLISELHSTPCLLSVQPLALHDIVEVFSFAKW